MEKRPTLSSFSIIVAFVAISLAGLAVIPSLTVKLLPSRTYASLTVSFNLSGNPARIVEMEATSKLESMLARISGLRSIRSTSGNGYGNIRLELDKHASLDMVRLEASTIIRQTWPSLPSGASYPTISVNVPDQSATGPFITYNINAQVSPILIQEYAENNIKPVLAQFPDIYRIDISGATPMEWMVEYDITQLDALGISVNQISEAVYAYYNQKISLGMALVGIDKGDEMDKRDGKLYKRMSITTENEQMQKGFHADEIFLTDKDGQILRLDQLVSVTYRESPPTSYFRINGLNSIYLSIYATENANQLRLGKAVREEIAMIKQVLPKGYEMHLRYDATEKITTELNKIYIRTVFTVLILLVFVFLTTFNARYLLLITLSLYFNIAIAFIFYYLLGLEIQLNSLAGITISLSLVIDNTIIMTDHYLRNHDRKAFISILTATLTTVGALTMIFFLNENIRLTLQDFAAVVMINLTVSLAVSLFFVPATIEKMKVKRKSIRFRIRRRRFSPKRIAVHFNRIYLRIIRILLRFRAIALIVLILAFGLPVFMLPDKINKENKWAERYNKIATSTTYKDKVRPVIDKSLGGTLRLFVQKVYSGGYYARNRNDLVVYISANMPNGSTLAQINYLVQQMESYLSQFKEIRQFQTNVSPYRATIQVYFTRKAEKTGFPYQLKNDVISKAMQLGGGSWTVTGLQDQNYFSNDVREPAGSMQVKFYGYNYDDLYMHASAFRDSLLTRRRIKDVIINSEYLWQKDDYVEYLFFLDKQRMAAENIRPDELYASLSPVFRRNQVIGAILGDEQIENIKMSSKQSRLYDLWSLSNMSRSMNGNYYKIGELATIDKGQTPQNIIKEQQQYILCVQYDYVGAYQQGNRILEELLEKFNKNLPLGYTAQNERRSYSWGSDNSKQYLFLGVIILIIFFMTSILFNSLKQPLSIIFVIPVSYIGVFLTFYLFKLGFDHGGFAAFVLLCGITVNASIYLIYEYNRILRHKPLMNPVKAYIKSWNIKIVPIFLTVISTILGFIPFMVGLDKESFWFPLAVGTIGGLIMSMVGVFFFLPIFLMKRRTVVPKRKKIIKKPVFMA